MVTNRIDMNIIRYSLPVEGTLLMAICLHQAVLLYFWWSLSYKPCKHTTPAGPGTRISWLICCFGNLANTEVLSLGIFGHLSYIQSKRREGAGKITKAE